MRIRGLSIILLVASLVQAQTPSPQFTPPPPPEQPLPYSHKEHLFVPVCELCHQMPEPGHYATLPDTALCMICHTSSKGESPHIQELAQFHQNNEEVPWKPVYRIPDYVSFSHQAHVTGAGFGCEVCHGPVEEMEQMQKVKPITMTACMECHRQESAPIDCDYCHEPL